jgi:hypothetical protein
VRKSTLAVSLLSPVLLLGATVRDGTPRAQPAWNAPPAPQGGPSDGEVSSILDGTWWKLKVKARGHVLDPGTGLTTKGNWSTTAYMLLTPNPPLTSDGGGTGTPAYAYAMFTETAEDQWSNEYGDLFFVDGLDANSHHALSVNTFLYLITGTQAVGATHTGRLTIKVDSEGALTSARLKTLGAELIHSQLDGSSPGDDFFGTLKLAGKTIDPSELPFEL